LAPTKGVDAIYSGLLECPLTTRIRKHITGGGWNDTVLPQVFACDGKAEGCTHRLTTAQACFGAPLLGLESSVKILNRTGHSETLPAGCSVSVSNDTAQVYFNTNTASKACCRGGGAAVEGVREVHGTKVSLSLRLSNQTAEDGAEITLTGPSDVWYGVGFDAVSMSNSPYAMIVDGATGNVTEHVLGKHAIGVQINTTVTVVSSTVHAGSRTVVMRRPLRGATPQHHSFDATKLTLDFISAVGASPHLSYHKAKASSSISLWPGKSRPACLCSIPAQPFGKGEGTLEYMGGPANPAGETIGFPYRCNPTESVMANRNPTCDIRTYEGGLSTCHHRWHLLDADQEVPWLDQPLVYYMKYRLYFQAYNPAQHVQAFDITWSIAGDTGEYDVPQCPVGTPVDQCTHEITGEFTPPGTDLHFVAAHYHCHAPTCLLLEIYNNVTGELICSEAPYHGQSRVITGGDRFDEAGYIAQRVCLWGPPPFEPPPLVSGVPLFVRAVTNNTYGHHGEMALPQMLLASIPMR